MLRLSGDYNGFGDFQGFGEFISRVETELENPMETGFNTCVFST